MRRLFNESGRSWLLRLSKAKRNRYQWSSIGRFGKRKGSGKMWLHINSNIMR